MFNTVVLIGLDTVSFQLTAAGEKLCRMVAEGVTICLNKKHLQDCTASEMGMDGTTLFYQPITTTVVSK